MPGISRSLAGRSRFRREAGTDRLRRCSELGMKLLPHCSGRRHAAVRVLLLGLLAWSAAAEASIRVDIDGVDADLRRNIQALLSLERYKDRERIEPEAVERLYRRADDEVRSALRPFGYYEPRITASLQPEDAQHVWHVH